MCNRFSLTAVVALVLTAMTLVDSAEAWTPPALRRAANYNWHGRYYHSQYGQPVALVVPPTAELQTNWGWGVGSSRISRIDHQFGRDYYGANPGVPQRFSPTPAWPHDTTNFGAYYVRGPW